MFARAASTLRNTGRTLVRQQRNAGQQQRRNMGGGSHWMEVSDVHTKLGEAFGFVCWLWVFHRARNDLPVVLGWRHPWEHAEDPWASHDVVENVEELEKEWDLFAEKAAKPGDGDDDDDDDDDDEEEEDEEEDEDDDED